MHGLGFYLTKYIHCDLEGGTSDAATSAALVAVRGRLTRSICFALTMLYSSHAEDLCNEPLLASSILNVLLMLGCKPTI